MQIAIDTSEDIKWKVDWSMTEINKINGNGLKNSGKISSNPKPEKGKEPNVNSIMVGGIKYNKNDVIQTRISQSYWWNNYLWTTNW